MPPEIIALTADEEQKLADLQARSTAWEEKRQTLNEERSTGLSALDELADKLSEKILGRIEREAKPTATKQDVAKAAASDERDWSSEFGKLADTINSKIADLEAIASEQERHTGGAAIGHDAETQRTSKDGEKFKLERAIAGHLCGWQGEASKYPEREMLHEHNKALQLGVHNASLLVPPQFMAEMIELLRPNLVAAELGASFRPFGGPVTIRKMKGGATSHWIAEGKKGIASEPTFGRMNLTPKPLMTIVPISEDLLDMGPGGLQGDLEADMARSQGESLDLGIFKGTGGEGQPSGIINHAGGTEDFSAINYAGATQNVTDLLDAMIYAIGARNIRGRVGFACHPLAIQKLRTVKDANGAPLLFETRGDGGRNPQDPNGGVETGIMHGMRYATSTAFAYGTTNDDLVGMVGSEVIVGQFGMTDIRPSYDATDPVSGDSAYLQRELWVRMTTKWDSSLRHTEAVQIADSWNNS